MTRRTLNSGTPVTAELAELLERAKDLPPPTRQQIEAQRKSWVIGEMLLEHPEMTREEVEAIYDRVAP